jgi:Uma2 family endonuclease
MSAHNMRVPDILVSCSPFDLKQAAPDNPVVIIEILSPSNRADTWANVWAYTRIPSVQDIFVLRPDIVGGDLLRRAADGTWPDQAAWTTDELSLDSIGFRLALTDLYARTPLGRA